MVKIVEGYKERMERINRADLIGKLALGIFGQKRISCPPYDERISIYSETGASSVAEISPITRDISVDREKDYQDCLRLAEECEKALGEEFTLRIEYSVERP